MSIDLDTVATAQLPSHAALRRTRTRPRMLALRVAGWLLLSALLGACLVGWWLDASLAGRDRAAVPRGRAESLHLRAETPILWHDGTSLRSAPRPAATVALTFSGGLDDAWVERAAAILRRHRRTATFFLTGQALIEHPGRARSLQRAGHEIGVNAYSEVDLANLADWQVRLHLSTTQTLAAAATGEGARLFRPPGAQPLRGIDRADVSVAELAAADGYTVVLADRVAAIWDPHRSATELIRDVVPAEGTSAVIEFPTPTPERQDAAAGLLQYLLTALDARDTPTATISDYGGWGPDALHPPAPAADRWRGEALATALPLLGAARGGVHSLAVVLLVLGLARMAIGVAVAWSARREPDVALSVDDLAVPLSVVIAARDEAATIAPTIAALAASSQRVVEIIVVDDGSTDGTGSVVTAMGALRDGVTVQVIRQDEATGKPAALNAGLLVASHEIVVCVDADTEVEPDALGRLARLFADPDVGAVSGQVVVGNPRRLLGRFQSAEYAVGCGIERRLLDRLGFVTCVTGAVGAYRAAAIRRVGGFSSDTCAEDTDVALALQGDGWTARYAADARALTTVPLTLRGLWTQRVRWSLGVAQSIWKHRRSRRDGSGSSPVNRKAIPYLVVFGGLSVLGPVVDAVAVFAILTARLDQLVAVWAVLVAMTTALTAIAFAVDGRPVRGAWVVPLQIVLYRPFLYLAHLRALQIASMGLQPAWRRRRRTQQRAALAPPRTVPSSPVLSSPADAAAFTQDDGTVVVPPSLAPAPAPSLAPAPGPAPAPAPAPAEHWQDAAFRMFAADQCRPDDRRAA